MSLSCLANVINILSNNQSDFVPYRDSKLTRLLKDSLGGNFKTTLVVTCSPHYYNLEETISTLNFAKRAKRVKNKVKLNIKRDPEELERIIQSLENKLKVVNKEIYGLSRDIQISPKKKSFQSSEFLLSPTKLKSKELTFTTPKCLRKSQPKLYLTVSRSKSNDVTIL